MLPDAMVDDGAWAEMLSMIGQKNSRLYGYLSRGGQGRNEGRTSGSRTSGTRILEELERERSRIARELHAGAGQPLAGIKMNLEVLDGCSATLPEAGREAMARMQVLAEQALEQVRAVSHSLHPPDWQGLTVGDSLRFLVESSGLKGRLQVEIDIQPLPMEPSHAVKIAIYRCAQECISNVTRHSDATQFSLSLHSEGAGIELRLADNGSGFSVESSGSRGIGLRAMREHAEALGGACEVSAGLDGVKVTVRLPLEED